MEKSFPVDPHAQPSNHFNLITNQSYLMTPVRTRCGKIYHPSGYHYVYLSAKGGDVFIQKADKTAGDGHLVQIGKAKTRTEAIALARKWLSRSGL